MVLPVAFVFEETTCWQNATRAAQQVSSAVAHDDAACIGSSLPVRFRRFNKRLATKVVVSSLRYLLSSPGLIHLAAQSTASSASLNPTKSCEKPSPCTAVASDCHTLGQEAVVL